MNPFLLLALLLFLLPGALTAAPMTQEQVPDPLKPWVAWALHGKEEANCPFLYDDARKARCKWPGVLTLAMEGEGGRFRQPWTLMAASWIPLPGNEENWPEEVMVNDVATPVVPHGGRPSLYVPEPGSYVIAGKLHWNKLPEYLPIPMETGLLELTLMGREVPFPSRDERGRLWPRARKSQSEEKREEDRLELIVHRRIEDGIPFTVTTRVELSISGKNREILLDQPLFDNLIPMRLKSDLPARVEPDGRVRIQARPGRWEMVLTQRAVGPVTALALPEAKGSNWVEEEVWVFAAQNHLRLTALTGMPAVDPQQTTLPDEWKRLPSYLAVPGQTLTIEEKKRGDPDPDPDQLQLSRTWWLDFDGKGLTVKDHITGTVSRSRRLAMRGPAQLGRISVNGEDQFITRLPQGEAVGVELREKQLNLSADSRLQPSGATLDAVGWDHDFQGLSGRLQLPPGWRLFHVSGVDQARTTWVNRWTLMDLFLTLIIALSAGRLWGNLWGGVALLAVAVNYHENTAIAWLLLHVIIATALLRVAPEGWLRKAVTWYRAGSLIFFILILLPYFVQQARVGLYPQLERRGMAVQFGEAADNVAAYAPQSAEESTSGAEMDLSEDGEGAIPQAPPMAQMAIEQGAMKQKAISSIPNIDIMSNRGGYNERREKGMQKLNQIDPNIQVQTGPGLPDWRWSGVDFTWNGPVQRDQQIELWLLGPGVNRALCFLRILLIALVAWRVSGILSHRFPGFLKGGGAAALLLLALLLPGSSQAGGGKMDPEVPPPQILEELARRLTEKEVCQPACADISRMAVVVAGSELTLRLMAHASADVALPLPGDSRHWLPRTVIMDGEPATGILRDAQGRLLVLLKKGIHQILLQGPLPNRERVQIALPVTPRRSEVEVSGWEVEGVREDGRTEGSLLLTREVDARRQAEQSETFESPALPPFVRVTRQIRFDLTWSVETTVTRLTPADSAVVLKIPLLPGESVTTSGARVEKGHLLVNMAHDVKRFSWSSILPEQGSLTLSAPRETSWSENWRFLASPVWHIESQGIPVIQHHAGGHWSPLWRPWPGEEVVLTITRPQGVPGRTLTLQRSKLSMTPGLRASDVSLDLVMKSSQGGQHGVRLPDGAELLAVSINGREQPIGIEGGVVTLPLSPGVLNVGIQWRLHQEMGSRIATPAVDVGLEGVNASIEVQMPRDRWVLFAGGPTLGPAVLFWGVLLVILLIAAGLGRIPWVPLRTYEWLLLGCGLTTVLDASALVIAAWFILMGKRGQTPEMSDRWRFNLRQMLLILWTLLAAGGMLAAIEQGLLGHPEMQISGNGSSAWALNWFTDRHGSALPSAWVLTVPLLVYRLLMLLWALWLAWAVVRWARWGWTCYATGGIWQKGELLVKPWVNRNRESSTGGGTEKEG